MQPQRHYAPRVSYNDPLSHGRAPPSHCRRHSVTVRSSAFRMTDYHDASPAERLVYRKTRPPLHWHHATVAALNFRGTDRDGRNTATAGGSRLRSSDGRCIIDSRTVCGGWSGSERACPSSVRGGRSRTAGHGGITASSRATGLARSTIGRGLKDLDDPGSLVGKVRRPGSGRPALTSKDTTLLEDLRQLLEPATMGDPMRPLRWVSKSHAKLAAALCAMGHQIAKSSIPKLLVRPLSRAAFLFFSRSTAPVGDPGSQRTQN